MTPERWREVTRIYGAVLARPADARAAAVDQLCGADGELRAEVESLLAEGSALGVVDRAVTARPSLLEAARGLPLGTGIGAFRIEELLGVGGMGEVYRARDTKLNRDVAIKILPAAFAADPDRLARFKREAQMLAALNHPNIAAIHGLEEAGGTQALVLELVDGPTLADRIAHGPLPVEDALTIARQIAEALEAAHEQGIVHRDLKPANIKVRDEGTVKVLDFGLAKIAESGVAGETSWAGMGNLTNSPTITTPAMTAVGIILGTAAYMSPEQAKGKPADKRSDIWAFGCVLYEMLVGDRVFAGEDATETIAAVIRADPKWSALPQATPTAVRRLLRRCLAKNKRDRLPHIGAARLELDEALADPDEPVAVDDRMLRRQSRRSARLAWGVATTAVVALLALVAYGSVRSFDAPVDERRVTRSTIAVPSRATVDEGPHPALSPDGRRLAFIANDPNGGTAMFVRTLDGVQPQRLAGTEGASAPFWSPDSQFLGFIAGGKLKKIAASGGPVVPLCDAETEFPGAWSPDGVILFTPRTASPLYQVRASGGTPSPVTAFDAGTSNLQHAFPSFLPGGRHFLYLSQTPNASARQIEIGSLDGGSPTRLMEAGSNAIYSQGHVVFVRNATLMAQPFDTARLALSGDAVPLAEDVAPPTATLRSGTTFSVSEKGDLVYVTSGLRSSRLMWRNRGGDQIEALDDPDVYGDMSLSPDGLRVAVGVSGGGGGGEIWLRDVRSGARGRLVAAARGNTFPAWSPAGDRIVFASRRRGQLDLFIKMLSSPPGDESLLFADSLDKFPTSWSPDGRFILFQARSPETETDLWILPATEQDPKPYQFVHTRAPETGGQFSPEGGWIAYASDESRQPEVFVKPFPGPGDRQQISINGGTLPQWRGDGKEIFYRTPENRMVATEITIANGRLAVGRSQTLFDMGNVRRGGRSWDVAPDGQRFLVVTPADSRSETSLGLLQNWPTLLRKQ